MNSRKSSLYGRIAGVEPRAGVYLEMGVGSRLRDSGLIVKCLMADLLWQIEGIVKRKK